MTTDLDRLIEAVAAGQWNAVVAARIPGIRAQGDFAWKAFEGSIDAAVALLEALLPGWWAEISIRGSVHHAEVEEAGGGETACADNMPSPARALLLATLRAYRSTRDGQP